MKKRSKKLKFGIVFMSISIVLFLSLPVIPFLNLDSKTRIVLATSVFVAAEILFWGSSLLIGRELYQKYKSYLDPKRLLRKKDTTLNQKSNSTQP